MKILSMAFALIPTLAFAGENCSILHLDECSNKQLCEKGRAGNPNLALNAYIDKARRRGVDCRYEYFANDTEIDLAGIKCDGEFSETVKGIMEIRQEGISKDRMIALANDTAPFLKGIVTAAYEVPREGRPSQRRLVIAKFVEKIIAMCVADNDATNTDTEEKQLPTTPMDYSVAYGMCVAKQNSYLPNPAPNDVFIKTSQCLAEVNQVYMAATQKQASTCIDYNPSCLLNIQNELSNNFIRVLKSYGFYKPH